MSVSLLDTIYDVKRMTNRQAEGGRACCPPCSTPAPRHGQLVLERIGSDYGVPVLDPPIPKSIRFAEAPALGRSVLSTAHGSKGATAYRDVGESLLAARP